MKRAVGTVALIAMLLVVTQGTTLAKGASRLVVDDDHLQCRDAAFTTLASAIEKAHPGDTIIVCPGTYAGATVNKAIQVRASAGQDRAGQRNGDQNDGEHADARGCLSPASPDLTRDAVLTGTVTLSANGSELRGFTVQGAAPGGGGVVLGATATVSGNCFRGNATAITARLTVRGGSISRNQFIGQTKAAVLLNGATGVTVEHNVLVNSAAIRLTAASDNVIRHNDSSGTLNEAIRLDAGSQRNTISHNALNGGPAALARHNNGIRFDGLGISANVVEHNTVVDFGKSGIRLKRGATGNTFRDNRVDHNGLLEDENGFELSAGATGNVFVGNHMHRNQIWDAFDKNLVGANTWRRSDCVTSDPASICAARP